MQTQNAVLAAQLNQFRRKAKILPSMSSKRQKCYEKFQHSQSSQIVFVETLDVFLIVQKKKIDKRPNFFPSMSKNGYRVCNLSKTFFPSKCSYGHGECLFKNTTEKDSLKGQQLYNYCPKSSKKHNFIRKNSSLNIHMDTWKAVLTTPPVFIYRKNFLRSMSHIE